MSPVDQNRHGGGEMTRGLGDFGVWRCPACGVDQTTPFEQGCPGCGAGKPGEHVGVPPPPSATPAFEFVGGDEVSAAFLEWAKRRRLNADAVTTNLLADAFMEGVMYGRGTAPLAVHSVIAPTVYTAKGAAARTIAAALTHFRDSLYLGADEEIASHEWVDRAELDRLIRQYTQAGVEIEIAPQSPDAIFKYATEAMHGQGATR